MLCLPGKGSFRTSLNKMRNIRSVVSKRIFNMSTYILQSLFCTSPHCEIEGLMPAVGDGAPLRSNLSGTVCLHPNTRVLHIELLILVFS